MAIRKNEDFPFCQYIPSGIGVFLRSDFGWIVQLDFDGRSGRIKVVAFEVKSKTDIRKSARGRTHDITQAEARTAIDHILAHHNVTAQEALPEEMRRYVYQEESA